VSTLRSIIKQGKEGNGDKKEGSGGRPFSGVGARLARRLTSAKAPDRSPRSTPGVTALRALAPTLGPG
jgi:hypothetical protein